MYFGANVFRAFSQGRFQVFHRLLRRDEIGRFLRCDQPVIILNRKFRINRQPDRVAVLVARQLDRELDDLAAAFARFDIARELFRSEHLIEKRAELHFAPATARFHIRQHALQTAHIARQLLHRAEPLMHLFEPIAYQLERFAKPFLERAL